MLNPCYSKKASKFWVVESGDEAWIIGGTYLTKGLTKGETTELKVEIDEETDLLIFSPEDYQIKGEKKDKLTKAIYLKLKKEKDCGIPELKRWKYRKGSPEIMQDFDDSAWKEIEKEEELEMDKHGFHYGYTWYRGYFESEAKEDLTLKIDARHCYSIYVNGKYIGKHVSFPSKRDRTDFIIPANVLKKGKNILAVITESLGHEKNWIGGKSAKNPRGIVSAEIKRGFKSIPVRWKIQGDLYGERERWTELEFDDVDWKNVTLPHTPSNQPCIGWYRTYFKLSIPDDLSLPLGIIIENAHSKANVYLNGFLLGRYWDEKGPQHKFYLPKGALDTKGKNVLIIKVWNRGEDAILGKVYLEPFQMTQKVSIKSKIS